MGNSPNQSKPINSKHQYSFKYIIGKGGFGQVWLVQDKKSKASFALKEMSKARIVNRSSVHSVMNERKLLSMLKHPFLVNMQSAFQDNSHLYLVMDLMSGGDLRKHLNYRKQFSEAETKFFTACIITGLEYLHLNKVIHRDIKPENLVMDSRGYLRITDLGIARRLVPDNGKDTSGTPGFMAPEVICRQNHGIGVDYFALGVIIHEFMTGYRPYNGRSRKELKDMMLTKQAQLKKSQVPPDWSMDSVDFINKLIMRRPIDRLGRNGPSELKNHSWFRGFDWKKLFAKTIRAPYKPSENRNLQFRRFEYFESDTESLNTKKPITGLFDGYDMELLVNNNHDQQTMNACLLYTSDAADE